MSSFFTPIRKSSLRRLGSAHSDALNEDENEDPSASLEGGGSSHRGLSNWKKLRQRVRVARRGSVLHRNSERGEHLRSLFVKRRIKEALMNSLNIAAPPLDVAPSDQEPDYELSVNTAAMAMIEQYDASFLEEVKKEIEKEMVQHQHEPAIIQELNSIGKEYQERLKGYNEFPLEVRLKNFTYTVPVDERNSKIQTVYNASCLYPIAKMLKRIAKGEPRVLAQARVKVILSDINLVLKPGQQYLVLGPPASGKSTLLQAIAGQLTPSKYDTVEGSISYNGRTLAVCVATLLLFLYIVHHVLVSFSRNGLLYLVVRNRMSFSSKMRLLTLISWTSTPRD